MDTATYGFVSPFDTDRRYTLLLFGQLNEFMGMGWHTDSDTYTVIDTDGYESTVHRSEVKLAVSVTLVAEEYLGLDDDVDDHA